MALLETILFVVQVLVAVTLCGLILLQHGKGADMGAAFGSGSSGSLFGAAGSANFLSRTTAILAAVFFLTSLGLTYLGTTHAKSGLMQQGVMQDAPSSKAQDAPASKAADGTAPAPAPVVPAPAPTGTASTSKAADVPK
jgi:preprotein translocase subunit SecG